ncbi:hypothetical protein GCM10008983_04450 [Lentibacillus halophilus]|uniref:Uncharacterized protein n=1 Tax=Lentibacillus halophilus TaxID=295065 RepID=A0ABP3IZL9_9BACI
MYCYIVSTLVHYIVIHVTTMSLNHSGKTLSIFFCLTIMLYKVGDANVHAQPVIKGNIGRMHVGYYIQE